jgi:hypothetical protein
VMAVRDTPPVMIDGVGSMTGAVTVSIEVVGGVVVEVVKGHGEKMVL